MYSQFMMHGQKNIKLDCNHLILLFRAAKITLEGIK